MATEFAEVWNEMTGLVRRIKALEAVALDVGRPRSLAPADTVATWREVTMKGETFRVLTIEEKQ